MTRLSSDWTLFYKIFMPNMWIVFFGVAIGIIVFSMHLPILVVACSMVFYFGGLLFLYFTLLQLKRVEADTEHLYVTNYFKTYRYTFDSVAKITATDIVIFKVVTLHFHEKTSFGKKIHFIRRRVVWEEFLLGNDQLAPLYPR